jgi:DNA adenine methylase
MPEDLYAGLHKAVANDLDPHIIELFEVLKSREYFIRFSELVLHTPFSRELWELCRACWSDEADKVMRVWRWWVVARMSFAGEFGSGWGVSITSSSRGMSATVSGYQAAVKSMVGFHRRLQGVELLNVDAMEVIEAHLTDTNAFMFLDPPYVASTRSCGQKSYHYEFDHHAELVECLLRADCKVMLCGYNHEVYNPLCENGWHMIQWDTLSHAVPKTRVSGVQGKGSATGTAERTECAWVNYDKEAHLL